MLIFPIVSKLFILTFNLFLMVVVSITSIFVLYLILKLLQNLKVLVDVKMDKAIKKARSFGKGELVLERKCCVYGIVIGINSKVYSIDTPATFFVDKLNSYSFSNVRDLGLLSLCKDNIGKIKAYNEETNLYCVVLDEELTIDIGSGKLKLSTLYAPYECLLLKEKSKIKEGDFTRV